MTSSNVSQNEGLRGGGVFLGGGIKRWEEIKMEKTIFLENKSGNGGVLGMNLGFEGRIKVVECYFKGNRGAC